MNGRPFLEGERAADRRTAADLYQQGHTIACVALVVGRSWNTARLLVLESGTRMRRRGTRCTATHTQENTR